jgi:hypothetical protein
MSRDLSDYRFDGWRLLGKFPEDDPDGVGSWLLPHDGESLLLEIPPGLSVERVEAALEETDSVLKFVFASHDHWDHVDPDVWQALFDHFESATFIDPNGLANHSDWMLKLGTEPVWLIKAPKHSINDTVTVFRGVAMTGDIELQKLASGNTEVSLPRKRKSMAYLQGFPTRTGYRVHTAFSAHLNSLRRNVHWEDLFEPRDG